MSYPDSGLCRVAVHTDTAQADLTLPSGVPVATLIAAVVDLMPQQPMAEPLRPYRLCEPGRSALDSTKTLAQQGVRDGSTLVLTHAECRAPRVLFADPAEQAAAAVRATERPWGPAARRLTAALTASGLAGVAGLVAVPGGPGALLAATAAGTVALMTVPSSGASGPVRTTACCLAGLAILTAVTGMAAAVTGIARPALGALAATTGVGLIRIAGRIAAAARRRHAPGTAHDLLTGVVAAAAALVVLGTAGAVSSAAAPSSRRAPARPRRRRRSRSRKASTAEKRSPPPTIVATVGSMSLPIRSAFSRMKSPTAAVRSATNAPP